MIIKILKKPSKYNLASFVGDVVKVHDAELAAKMIDNQDAVEATAAEKEAYNKASKEK